MIVHCRLLYAFLLQLRHDWLDLPLAQDQITHDHGVVAHAFERQPRPKCETSLDRGARNRDLQVRAGHAEFVDIAWLHRSLAAECVLDCFPLRRSVLLSVSEARRSTEYCDIDG